jgi:N-alpha-acetyltransferase 30
MLQDGKTCVGTIVCKLETSPRSGRKRGYIAMLAVSKTYRRKKLGSRLVVEAIRKMKAEQADDVVLETELCNSAAIDLYMNLGFLKTKFLPRYYMNGNDAYRLKLALTPPNPPEDLYRPISTQTNQNGAAFSDSE